MPYPTGHTDPKVADVMNIFIDWFNALEAGTVYLRRSDPNYVSRDGLPWTEERAEKMVASVESYFISQQKLWAYPGSKNQNSPGATHSTGFDRLTPDQKLAMAQELDDSIRRFS